MTTSTQPTRSVNTRARPISATLRNVMCGAGTILVLAPGKRPSSPRLARMTEMFAGGFRRDVRMLRGDVSRALRNVLVKLPNHDQSR